MSKEQNTEAQKFGKDPLWCERCGTEMVLWKVWMPTRGVVYYLPDDAPEWREVAAPARSLSLAERCEPRTGGADGDPRKSDGAAALLCGQRERRRRIDVYARRFPKYNWMVDKVSNSASFGEIVFMFWLLIRGAKVEKQVSATTAS